MSMSISEAQAEIRSHYEKAAAIENRYPTGLTEADSAEDFAEVKRLLGTIDQLEDKLSGLEDAASRKERILGNQTRLSKPANPHQQPTGDYDAGSPPLSSKSFASQFLDSAEYKRIIDSQVLNNPSSRVEMGVKLDGSLLQYLARKALVTSGSGSGGALVSPERVSGIDLLTRELSFLDLIPTASTSSNSLEYYEQLTRPTSAAFVAEATATTGATGYKPEGSATWVLRNSPVGTLAEWIPITNAMLSDAPAMDGIIRSQLLLDLQLVLESQVINGNGTPPNLTGLLTNANIQTLGLGAGSGSAVDAIYQAMTQVMVTGFGNPTASVWHPSDFQDIRLARENAASGTLGGYLLGPPSMQGPSTLWGRPAVLSIGMPEHTAVTADFARACMLFDREQAQIRTGLINDQFVRNMMTILAELRAAFVVFRPSTVARVTGI